jgi:hypothetical protein
MTTEPRVYRLGGVGGTGLAKTAVARLGCGSHEGGVLVAGTFGTDLPSEVIMSHSTIWYHPATRPYDPLLL